MNDFTSITAMQFNDRKRYESSFELWHCKTEISHWDKSNYNSVRNCLLHIIITRAYLKFMKKKISEYKREEQAERTTGLNKNKFRELSYNELYNKRTLLAKEN